MPVICSDQGALPTLVDDFMLFVPFSILLLWAFEKELLGESENIRFGKTVWEATKVVAVFSFLIEFTQLLFHSQNPIDFRDLKSNDSIQILLETSAADLVNIFLHI